MDRRQVVGAALSIGMGGALQACAEPAKVETAGFEMPAEAEPHERCFMQWPVSLEVYDRPSLRRVQDAIALIANTISRYEPVVMLADAGSAIAARKKLGPDVEIWDIATDDLWCRDSGPTFVRGPDGTLAVSHIQFNGWGHKQPHSRDAKVAERVAQRLGLRLIPSGLIGEQGGVEHDGNGLLLAHASCWANPNRNKIPLAEIERRLLRALGGQKMIWAPGVMGKDITDYHIDALARFVGQGKVLIQLSDEVDPEDPWSVSGHQTLGILAQSTDVSGRPLQIIQLPEPTTTRVTSPDFVASYVNYYIANGAVIAGQFGDKQADGRAREVLQDIYPGRRVEMINIDAIGEVGGGIHCATQQQPKART